MPAQEPDSAGCVPLPKSVLPLRESSRLIPFLALALLFVTSESLAQFTVERILTAPDGDTDDFFGRSVAISGDTVLVGAFHDDVGFLNADQGSAYVFRRNGTEWTFEQQLTADDGGASDLFGVSVALSGDTALVGIAADAGLGAAYVFVRSGTTWTQQQKLTPGDNAAGDNFGTTVALGPDTAIIGSLADDVGGNVDQGSAYVFTRSGTIWSEQQKLTASDGAAGDLFGQSVALEGDTAIVGADRDDAGVNLNQGSAYVFTRSGSMWTEQQQLTASDGDAQDQFGISVAVSGDTVLVGDARDDVLDQDDGSAYVFTRSDTTWTEQQKLIRPDGENADLFGQSVALSGDVALVSAHLDDVGGRSQQGSARVFTRSGSTWTAQQDLIASDGDGSAGDSFSISVALEHGTAVGLD